jgi:hypothetical protein
LAERRFQRTGKGHPEHSEYADDLPAGLLPEDVTAARQVGVSDQALADALHVAFLFNVINRLADVFGANYEGDDGRRLTAAGLYRQAYQVPDFFLR